MSYGGGYGRYGSGSSYTPGSRYGSGSTGYGSSRGLTGSGSSYTPSTDRYSRPGAGSRLSGDSSSSGTTDRFASRNSAAPSSYSTRDKDKAASTPCASCKKIVEEKDTLIAKLQQEVKSKTEEVADLKSQLSKSGTGRAADSRTSDNDKRERRALERRISELEEEVKTVKQLKADNQRLKDENGALVRVISKLSK